MTILDFYKELSRILTDTREEFLSTKEAQKRLDSLLETASSHKLDVKIDPKILDPINLMRLDDERSFKSDEDDDYSFEADGEFSY